MLHLFKTNIHILILILLGKNHLRGSEGEAGWRITIGNSHIDNARRLLVEETADEEVTTVEIFAVCGGVRVLVRCLLRCLLGLCLGR